MQGEVIVGLDIGTTKICSVVGEVAGDKTNIIGIGTNPSIGLRKGVVVNIESTVESIKKAVEEAELMAGCEISSVYAGIAGGHITGFNSRGIVAVKSSEISEQDVDRVIDAARAVAIPMDREVIHVLPQEYMVDDERGIQNPVGMSGVRLEAKIHIVTGAVASAHNIVKCANRSGLDVCDIVLESLASGEAVLTEEEKELGVALLDLGGGTTDLSLIRVEQTEEGLSLSRVGVGDHLMLGGDNMDLGLAHLVEARIAAGGNRLSAAQLAQLGQQCRSAKEELLGATATKSIKVTVLGSGTRLIGGARSSELDREEVNELVLEGFLPRIGIEERPRRLRGGIVEFGLPYVADPAITRHLADFLSRHARVAAEAFGTANTTTPVPDTVLLNGGVLRSESLALVK